MAGDIVLNERDYKRLLESRNAFASTLAALVELESKKAERGEQEHASERERILKIADGQLTQYGQHQAFVII